MLAITKEDFLEIERTYRIAALEREKADLEDRLERQIEETNNACRALCMARDRLHSRDGWRWLNLIIGLALGAFWMYVLPAVFDWLRSAL
jgi:hypothetical protein